jgi:hypothetical protein
MNARGRTLFYGLTTVVLVGNGALMLGWFLEPPNPDRVGYWFIIYFIGLPWLGTLGLLALVLRKPLKLPLWFGAGLIAYPALAYALMVFAPLLQSVPQTAGIYRLLEAFPGGFEGVNVLLWALCVGCVVASFRPSLSVKRGA